MGWIAFAAGRAHFCPTRRPSQSDSFQVELNRHDGLPRFAKPPEKNVPTGRLSERRHGSFDRREGDRSLTWEALDLVNPRVSKCSETDSDPQESDMGFQNLIGD